MLSSHSAFDVEGITSVSHTRSVLALATLLALAGCGDGGGDTIGDHPREEFGFGRGLFIAADDPTIVAADQATFLQPDDEVIGVVVRGEARAYPLPVIGWHHVENDHVGGVPIAVTY